MAKIVGVTSCITGIAHTYMAAEALERAGKKLGHEVTIETQGSAGTIPLKPEVIAAADAVIFAVDLEVKDRSRFDGKPYLQVAVAKAMKNAEDLINEVLAGAADGTAAKVGDGKSAAPKKESSTSAKDEGGNKGGLFGGLFGKKK